MHGFHFTEMGLICIMNTRCLHAYWNIRRQIQDNIDTKYHQIFFCWNMNMKPYIGSNERKHPLRCIQIFWTESMESTKEKHRHKTQQNACRVNIFTWKPLWKCSFSYVNQSTSVCSTSTQSRMNSHETS